MGGSGADFDQFFTETGQREIEKLDGCLSSLRFLGLV
jgi:hypothetical protein